MARTRTNLAKFDAATRPLESQAGSDAAPQRFRSTTIIGFHVRLVETYSRLDEPSNAYIRIK